MHKADKYAGNGARVHAKKRPGATFVPACAATLLQLRNTRRAAP